MLISETVIWDMLTNAFTPASRVEVDPAAAADDAINITRFEEVAHHHLGAGSS